MKVSVIIPTYKPQDYLWECLDSLEKQTLPKSDFEIILVLNGCRQPYESRIQEYLLKLDKKLLLNFIQTDIPGVSNARNIGLDNAKGEYCCFIDDDDYVSPAYLEELYEKSTVNTVALCYPQAFCEDKVLLNYRITKEYERRYQKNIQPFYEAKKFFSGPCMKMIHRSILGMRRFDTDFERGEDSLYMFLISDRIKYVDFTTSNAIYYRRVRTGSVTMEKRPRIEIIGNSAKMIVAYSKIYWGNIQRYNFYFYFTRVLGAIKSILLS